MIQASIYRTKNQITGFKLTGHADAAQYGSDIVCSAVSVLAINTINSIEKLILVQPNVESDDKNGGYLVANFSNFSDPKVQLLLESFELGIKDVSESYGKYIKVTNK